MVLKRLLLYYLILSCNWAFSKEAPESRICINLDKGWTFTKDKITPNYKLSIQKNTWQQVDLPHTWNATDVMDDVPGYYRGICWYRKTFRVTEAIQSKELLLHFEGANQQTEVYVNGQKAASHMGGYTGFYVPISRILKRFAAAENEILVRVDNQHNAAVPPLSADFTFYGGIYRSVNLVAVSKTHFSLDDYGSTGVYISTPAVSIRSGQLRVIGKIDGDEDVSVHTAVLDAAQQLTIARKTTTLASRKPRRSFSLDLNVDKPRLWSPEDPYRYQIIIEIKSSRTGRTLDRLSTYTGFRWYRFSADSGFFLNDKPYKLIGTSRHQDYKGLGNAVSKELACRDVQLLKEMGGNFLRVAHYPQDQCVLDACDSLGILTSVEIPLVNEITESEAFAATCRNMQREMIWQNYNHPSVVLWCSMNEILLRPQFANDTARQNIYFSHIRNLAQSLDSLTRAEDPSRYTMIACHGDFEKYRRVGLTSIPMVVGWNLYSGWYGGNLTNLPEFLEKHHRSLPSKPLIISEYGADADARIRSSNPKRFDKSVDYALAFHQYYLQQIMQRPFVAGAVVWNLADFNSESREESMPHINTKGLLTWDRQPKEIYRFYKAALHNQPYTPSPLEVMDSLTCSRLQPSEQVNIVFGAQRRFWDDSLKQWWLPADALSMSYSLTGKPFRMAGNSQFPYGTNKSIAGTENDPVYQTQQVGISYYHLQVPNGHYEVRLHFAELGSTAAKPLEYNLTSESTTTTNTQRFFDVYVNDSLLLSHFNIAGTYGAATAVIKPIAVSAANNNGIKLTFHPVEGEPVLNALQIKRLD